MRFWGWLFAFVLVGLVGVFAFFVTRMYFFAYTPLVQDKPVKIAIPKGSSGEKVLKILSSSLRLERGQVLKMKMILRVLSLDRKLKSGEYLIVPYSTPLNVFSVLARGMVVKYAVTIPEGSRIYEVAEIIEENGLAKRDEILRLASSAEFARKVGVNAPTLEGYLFPDTYFFTREDSPEKMLSTMVRRFKQKFRPDWKKRAAKLGFSIHEVVTLASIVEKEAVFDSERPVIAAVFLNRLKKGMPLQSDPTAVYDIPDFRGPVLKRHLRRDSPYNTYVIRGLPPTPICSPGEASIKAVLYPAQVPYLYFVSNGDGTHRFSISYSEHLKAIEEIRALKKANNGATGTQ
ncbi:MAG: endolytic transglycosylase MltG [Deltaproteobacteria bacterium]|nr:endolytic transglycosylase MltG [Deltaproteobacteria bacterium]